MFDINNKRAMQDEIAKTIVSGADNISDARVHITFAETSLFKEDAVEPTASVQIISRGNISKEQVVGIQNLVAGSVPRLDPSKVSVLGRNNKILSESSSQETGVGMKTKQLEVQLTIEEILRRKVEDALYILVGPDNYDVKVTAVLDWTKERSEQTDIKGDTPAVLSEKTYESENSAPSISGAPGVDSNTQAQDTGVGAQTASNETISESITNYQYPWTKVMKEMPIGEIKEISVSIALNYVEDTKTGERVKRPADLMEKLTRLTRVQVGLPADETADSIHKFYITDYPFDDSQSRTLARERLWANIASIVKMLLPLILLFALGYFVYIFFQSAFAPPEVAPEEEEEIPIEPVTEAKELSLSQLGLAEFGDIASLPAEEQRRLKMQEHVINYASEKPEEVAAIIKAWLSG
jgi:flagellar basal-body M-ring protein/flagellar hook-basal body protein fliF